jgi:hypothetical protein
MPDEVTDIDAVHPEEWVKYQRDNQQWIVKLLNEADNLLAFGHPRERLEKFLKAHPAPLPPNQR